MDSSTIRKTLLVVGNLFLKKRIFREADSNPVTVAGEPTALASLVRRVFDTAVFPNMVRTGHWIRTDDRKKLFLFNLIGDIQVSRVIRHVLMMHDRQSGARQDGRFIFEENN